MHLNTYLCHSYQPIDTKFCLLVCSGGRYFMPRSVFDFFYSIFSPVLDFEKVVFISLILPKCLFVPHLSLNRYLFLHTSFFRLYILHAAIVCFEVLVNLLFSQILIFNKVTFISMHALKCLCVSYSPAD